MGCMCCSDKPDRSCSRCSLDSWLANKGHANKVDRCRTRCPGCTWCNDCFDRLSLACSLWRVGSTRPCNPQTRTTDRGHIRCLAYNRHRHLPCRLSHRCSRWWICSHLSCRFPTHRSPPYRTPGPTNTPNKHSLDRFDLQSSLSFHDNHQPRTPR